MYVYIYHLVYSELRYQSMEENKVIVTVILPEDPPHQPYGSSDGIEIEEFSCCDNHSMYVYKARQELIDYKIVLGCIVRFYFTHTPFDSTETESKDFKVADIVEDVSAQETKFVFVVNTGGMKSIDKQLQYGVMKIIRGAEHEEL